MTFFFIYIKLFTIIYFSTQWLLYKKKRKQRVNNDTVIVTQTQFLTWAVSRATSNFTHTHTLNTSCFSPYVQEIQMFTDWNLEDFLCTKKKNKKIRTHTHVTKHISRYRLKPPTVATIPRGVMRFLFQFFYFFLLSSSGYVSPPKRMHVLSSRLYETKVRNWIRFVAF